MSKNVDRLRTNWMIYLNSELLLLSFIKMVKKGNNQKN